MSITGRRAEVGADRMTWTAPVVLFCVGTFFFWSSLYVYVPVLSVYARSKGASLTLAGLVVSAYGLTQLLTRIPIGFFSDVLGQRKPFVLVGLVAAGLGCLGLAWAPGPWFLVASRAVIGLGAATWVAFSVLFASYFALHRSAQAMSIINFVNGSAQALAGLAGGFLSQSLGTVSTFFTGAALAVIGLAVLLPMKEAARPERSEMSLDRLKSIAGTPVLIAASGIGLINTCLQFTTTQSFSPIYARGLGASDSQLGLLWTTSIAAFTLASLAGASAAERFGIRRVIFVGLLLAGVMTVVVPLTTSLYGLVATQMAAGLGRGVCTPILMSLSIRTLPAHERASAMGIYQAVYSIGMFAGPPLGGAVADWLGLGSVFILMGGLAGVGAIWGLTSPALR